MEIVIILAKSAAILTLFYVLYVAILKKETFFIAHRHYLLAGIVAALCIPFIAFTKTVYLDIPLVSPTPASFGELSPILLPETMAQETALELDWWLLGLVVYGVGVIIMLSRLTIQLFSLKKLLNRYPSSKEGAFTYVQINDNIAPFSFFNYICYNPELHTLAELQMIIEHEKVHASQWHTLDVLLTQVVLAIQWVNPIAWYYKKHLEQNLEFLADSGALRTVDSSTAYQHTLVKVSSTALRPALTNQFYHSLIKKRIVMLNKETSNRRNLWKLGLVLPLLGLFMYSFNVKEVIEYREITINEKDTAFAKADSEEIHQAFTIDAKTTDAYLKSIETFFESTFESTAVRFTKVNHINGKLLSFDFQTKMKDDTRFFTRFSINAKNHNLKPFVLTPIKEHEILQTYQSGHEVQFTPESSLTNITLTNEDPMGSNPVVVLNGNVIKTNDNKTTYATEEGITILSPQKAMAKYGGNARDGAIVIDDPNYTTKVNGKYIKHPAFVINHKTTTKQIKALELYFKENHPDALVDLHKVKRNSRGEIIGYNLRTKLNGQSDWQNILELNNKESIKKGLQVRYLPGVEIQFKELGPKGIEMRSTPKGLFINDAELLKGLTGFSKGIQKLSSILKDFKYPINKNTTDVQLDDFKKQLMKKHGLDLSYNLRRNEAREITSIQINYTGNGKNGNYSISGDQPIEEFYFIINEEGKTGFWSEKSEARLKEREVRLEERKSQLNEARTERSQAYAERRTILEEAREERLTEMKAKRKEMKVELKEMKEEMEVRQQEMKGRLEEKRQTLKEQQQALKQNKDKGYVTFNNTTYYFANEDSRTKFYTRFGEEVPETDPLYEKLFQQKNKDATQGNPLVIDGGVSLTVKTLTIDKNTSDTQLTAITKQLAQDGATLNISKIKRNAAGEIAGYRLKFDDGNGSKVSSSKKGGQTPITPFVINYDQNGKISLQQ